MLKDIFIFKELFITIEIYEDLYTIRLNCILKNILICK